MDGEIDLIIFGAILILLGVIFTPIFQSLGSASFWLGIILSIFGGFAIVINSR